MESTKNYFHLHLISDSTGETLIAAGRAAAAQFQSSQALEHVYPLIRNRKQLMPVLDAIDGAPGIVLYTIVDRELSEIIDRKTDVNTAGCLSNYFVEEVLREAEPIYVAA